MNAIIGSYNVGLILTGSRLPERGETVVADSFFEGGGGRGSNQAVAAATTGAPVGFVGRTGDDKFGLDAFALYPARDISCHLIIVDGSPHAGISIIPTDESPTKIGVVDAVPILDEVKGHS